MAARRSQIDRAIAKLDADILHLQSAREALLQVRSEEAKPPRKTTTKRAPAKAADA